MECCFSSLARNFIPATNFIGMFRKKKELFGSSFFGF
jgi:hypothetical protein